MIDVNWSQDVTHFAGEGGGRVGVWVVAHASLVGCIIRMTADGAFPPDNDGALWGGAPGCWRANGLRSPWRSRWVVGCESAKHLPYFSSFLPRWDLPTGRYFIGDVGGNDQSTAVEEVHIYHWGDYFTNFGWPQCDGSNCRAIVQNVRRKGAVTIGLTPTSP